MNTVQSSRLPQVAYLFWTLLTLQVIGLSYLTLGLASNTKLRSFPRFLASYTLNMMIVAYAFAVSSNIIFIFTGRTWFATSEAIVLVLILAVMMAFLVSISTVWGLRGLGNLKRDWSVHFRARLAEKTAKVSSGPVVSRGSLVPFQVLLRPIDNEWSPTCPRRRLNALILRGVLVSLRKGHRTFSRLPC